MRKMHIGVAAFGNVKAGQSRLERALEYLEEAAGRGCDLLCLPECFPGGVEKAEPIDGETIPAVAEKARELNLHVIAPIFEKRDGKVYNAAVVIDRRGRVLGAYDKVQPTEGEIEQGVCPGREMKTFELDGVRFGIITCFDIYFSDPLLALGRKNVDLVFFPSVNYGYSEFDCDTQLRAAAIDHGYWVAACDYAAASPYRPGSCLLHSYIAGPNGAILADPGYQEGVFSTIIDFDRPPLALEEGSDEPRRWCDILESRRRPELYGILADRGFRPWQEKSEERSLKVAGIALDCSPRRTLAEVLDEVHSRLSEAAELGAELACLPQQCTCPEGTISPASESAVEAVGRMAGEFGISVVSANYEKNEKTGLVCRARLWDDQGHLIGTADKSHLTSAERAAGVVPGDDLPVLETRQTKLGILIGDDFFHPEAVRTLSFKGAEIVCWCAGRHEFYPSARMTELLTRARAINNYVHLVVGAPAWEPPWKVGLFLRTASVIDSRGPLLADSGYRPGVAAATLRLPARRFFFGSYSAEEPFDNREVVARLRQPHLLDEVAAAPCCRKSETP